jgi:hypothetical protein
MNIVGMKQVLSLLRMGDDGNGTVMLVPQSICVLSGRSSLTAITVLTVGQGRATPVSLNSCL